MVSWRKRSKVCQSQTHCQLGLAGFNQYLWHTDELPEQYWTVYEESRNPFSCPEGTRRNYKTQQQEVGGQSLFSTCWGISSVDTVTLWHCDCDTEKLSLLWNTISDFFPVPSQGWATTLSLQVLTSLSVCLKKKAIPLQRTGTVGNSEGIKRSSHNDQSLRKPLGLAELMCKWIKSIPHFSLDSEYLKMRRRTLFSLQLKMALFQ